MNADIPSIYRIIVPVADAGEAVRFYASLLNMEGRGIGGGRHYFDCGPVILTILEGKNSPNSDYIYFSVANLEAVYERAQGLGCLSQAQVHDAAAGEIVKRPWGERSFYAYDPSGNGLCFVEEPTIFTGRR